MLDYTEITAEKLATALPERIEELHLAPRISVNGKRVLMKLQHYMSLFREEVEEQLAAIPATLNEDGEVVPPKFECPFPVYSGKALEDLLNSPTWKVEDQ